MNDDIVWDDEPAAPQGGTGIALPTQRTMQVTPQDQLQRDRAALVLKERELQQFPNDPALQKDVAASRKQVGAVAPDDITWDEPQQAAPTAPARTKMDTATDFAHGVVSAPARVNNTLEHYTPQGQVARYFKKALGIDKATDDINQRAAVTPNSTAGKVGSVVGDVALSLPAAATLPARIVPQVVGNAAIGAGLNQEDPLSGAAWGAGGGAVGHVLSKALGAVRAGAKPTQTAVGLEKQMRDANIKVGLPPSPTLTPGQMAPEGSWLRGLENSVAHTPFVGAPLRARQGDAMRGFQEYTRVNALPPGVNGESAQTVQGIKDAFKSEYDRLLSPVNIQVGADSVTNQPITKPAVAFQSKEAELKSEGARLMRSADLANINDGKRLMAEAETIGKFWRSQLPPDTLKALTGVDQAYARFVPVEKASRKGVGTLVTPEEYAPRAILKELRKVQVPKGADDPNFVFSREGGKFAKSPGSQKLFAQQADTIIGSAKPSTTTPATVGLSGLGLASLLTGTHIPAAGVAALAAGYGTKTGQRFARGAQRALTSEEVAATLNALRRAAPAAASNNKKEK